MRKNVFALVMAMVMATVMAMCCVAEASVPKDVFYIDTDDYPIVEKAYKAGIVTFDEPYFRPDEFVTRAEFAEFLQNIYDIKRRDEPMVWLYRVVLKRSAGKSKLRKALLDAYYAGSTGRKQFATYQFMAAMIYMVGGNKLTVKSIARSTAWANKHLNAVKHPARLSKAGKSGMMLRADVVEMLYYLIG